MLIRVLLGKKISVLASGLLLAITGGVVQAASTAPASAATKWTVDWSDNFNSLNTSTWGRYGWGYQAVGNGAMGRYDPSDVYTHDGVLALRTRYLNGGWTSAGVSSGEGFTASGGKWEVRAKMPTAKGIGYAFLLYPSDGSWPPEVDIAEGRVNGVVGSFYHYGAQNQTGMVKRTIDTHQWHTYGVILGNNQMIFTIDGDQVSGVVNNVPVTTKKMWLGFQTGAMDPNGSAKAYETVPGGIPNALTPASSEIQIAWVAHYHS